MKVLCTLLLLLCVVRVVGLSDVFALLDSVDHELRASYARAVRPELHRWQEEHRDTH